MNDKLISQVYNGVCYGAGSADSNPLEGVKHFHRLVHLPVFLVYLHQ
jgi:hypothetical protein